MTKKHTNVKLITTVIFTATFMSAIEGTIVTTSMPTIISTLKGVEMMNWVFAIYLLTMSMMTPIYGKLVDTIGRKPVFILSTLIFAFGSLLSGLSHSMLFLIIARGVQGIGAGGILPVTYTLLADLYEPRKRAKILGYNSAVWGIAGIIGPVLGGMIIKKLTWHWIFFINVPVAIVILFLLIFGLDEEKKTVQNKRLDLLGSFLLMGIILGLLLSVQLLGNGGISFPVIALFGLAILFSFLFYLVEKRAEEPVIPLNLFDNPDFNLINMIGFFISGFLIMLDVYMPMWLQSIGHYSPTVSGLVLMPMSISWMLGSFLAGRWIESFGDKKVLYIGGGITALTAFSLIFFTETTSIWLFLLLAVISGIGMGLQFTVFTVSVQVGVPKDEIGVATSFSLLVRNLGQTIIIAILGVLMNIVMRQNLPKGTSSNILNQLVAPHSNIETKNLPRELIHTLFSGLHTVVLFGFAVCILALVLVPFIKHPAKGGEIDENIE